MGCQGGDKYGFKFKLRSIYKDLVPKIICSTATVKAIIKCDNNVQFSSALKLQLRISSHIKQKEQFTNFVLITITLALIYARLNCYKKAIFIVWLLNRYLRLEYFSNNFFLYLLFARSPYYSWGGPRVGWGGVGWGVSQSRGHFQAWFCLFFSRLFNLTNHGYSKWRIAKLRITRESCITLQTSKSITIVINKMTCDVISL